MNKKLLAAPLLITLAGCMTTGTNIEASKVTDQKLTCEQIAGELQQMQTIIDDASAHEATAIATGVGASVGGHAANMGGNYMLGSAIGQLANLTSMSTEQRKEQAQKAEMRKSTLTGLYVGKAC